LPLGTVVIPDAPEGAIRDGGAFTPSLRFPGVCRGPGQRAGGLHTLLDPDLRRGNGCPHSRPSVTPLCGAPPPPWGGGDEEAPPSPPAPPRCVLCGFSSLCSLWRTP